MTLCLLPRHLDRDHARRRTHFHHDLAPVPSWSPSARRAPLDDAPVPEDVLTTPTIRPLRHQKMRGRARSTSHHTRVLAAATVTVPAATLVLLLAAAVTDAKTGLLTYAAWQRSAAQAVTTAARTRPGLRPHRWGLLIVDLDHFADLNARWSHPAVDEVLGHVAASLRRTAGPEAVIGRFGGDEFTILLSVSDTTELLDRAEHIRRAIEALVVTVSTPGGSLHISGITASIGAALHQPGAGEHLESQVGSEQSPALAELLWNADRALYDAKRAGRNTTRVRLIADDDA